MSPSRKEFVSEAEDLLAEAGEHLLRIQETGGSEPEALNGLFRSIHTLKGLSGLFGLEGLRELSHGLESLLDDLRLGRLDVTAETVRFLFRNLDVLKTLVRDAERGGEIDVTPHIRELEAFREGGVRGGAGDPLVGVVDEATLSVLTEYEEHRLRENIRQKRGVFSLDVVFPFAEFERALSELREKIKGVAELISTLPTSDNVPEDCIGFRLLFASAEDPHSLKEGLGIEPKTVVAPGSAVSGEEGQPSLKSLSTTLRVDIEKLDMILDTIGELAMTKGALKRIETELAEAYGHSHLIFDIHRVNQILGRRLSKLQDQIMEIRMIPIGQIFSRLSLIVRRYSREIGKPVELRVFGEETEIDKFIAEEIIDPLMHIVRNALDHGIEGPEERKAAGKPEKGRVVLRAFQRGNHVVVEVEDDGRGIDRERIRTKAVAEGIIPRGTEMEDTGLLGLIFRPGFSTKDSVSEISGRGVGMDVVRERISSLGGFVDVSTEEGRYTRFSVTIPITLAIIKSLLVRVGNSDFALPMSTISETLLIDGEALQSIEGRRVYNLRGELLPVVSIAEFFRIPGGPGGYIVVSGHEGRRIGLVVDELLGGQEIVIKSLGGYLEGLRGFAGAAEVGRHEVVLVIDVEALVEETLLGHRGLARV